MRIHQEESNIKANKLHQLWINICTIVVQGQVIFVKAKQQLYDPRVLESKVSINLLIIYTLTLCAKTPRSWSIIELKTASPKSQNFQK